MKNKILNLLLTTIFIFFAVIFTLSLRGLSGNPTADMLSTHTWKENGPFELSPERGRYALTYSLVEDKSFQFSNTIGEFALPDVAVNKGHYVSLFAPLVSIIVIPGFVIGMHFGLAQVGTFAVIALFALINFLLLRQIAIKLGADKIPATVAGAIFLFATPAFAYGVNLYQHHISTFLILLSLYILLKSNRAWTLIVVFFLCAISIPLDYPNLVFMAPIGIYALSRIITKENLENKLNIKINIYKLFTILIVIIPIFIFMLLNQLSYGNPLQLAGTLPSADVKAKDIASISNQNTAKAEKNAEKKSAIAFFDSRDLLNGFYIHTVSPDRGMLYFTPVMIFGFIGIIAAYKRKVKLYALMISIIGANILLYSMWGDPWGGWAFGSRYLIPTYAMLSIFIGLLLTYWKDRKLIISIFLVAAIYSISVNTLGALTTSANPPKVQILALEKITHHQQRYSVDRNFEYISSDNSKSFIFQKYLYKYISAMNYFVSIAFAISFFVTSLTIFYVLNSWRKGRKNV